MTKGREALVERCWRLVIQWMQVFYLMMPFWELTRMTADLPVLMIAKTIITYPSSLIMYDV